MTLAPGVAAEPGLDSGSPQMSYRLSLQYCAALGVQQRHFAPSPCPHPHPSPPPSRGMGHAEALTATCVPNITFLYHSSCRSQKEAVFLDSRRQDTLGMAE